MKTPLRGLTMRTPKTLPDVPTEDELRAVLAACPETLEGVRNRALLLVLADSGLRAGEVLRLLIEDCACQTGTSFTRMRSGTSPRRVGCAAAPAWTRCAGSSATRA